VHPRSATFDLLSGGSGYKKRVLALEHAAPFDPHFEYARTSELLPFASSLQQIIEAEMPIIEKLLPALKPRGVNAGSF
jgi:hypothetical protein